MVVHGLEWPAQWYNHDRFDIEKPFNGRNEQEDLIDEASATVKDDTTFYPYWTQWDRIKLVDNSSHLPTYKYLYLIFAENTGSSRVDFDTYWLASRYVRPASSQYCGFGLLYIYSEVMRYDDLRKYLRYSWGYTYEDDESNWCLRPFVIIPLTSCILTPVERCFRPIQHMPKKVE